MVGVWILTFLLDAFPHCHRTCGQVNYLVGVTLFNHSLQSTVSHQIFPRNSSTTQSHGTAEGGSSWSGELSSIEDIELFQTSTLEFPRLGLSHDKSIEDLESPFPRLPSDLYRSITDKRHSNCCLLITTYVLVIDLWHLIIHLLLC